MLKKVRYWLLIIIQSFKRYGLLITGGLIIGIGIFLGLSKARGLIEEKIPKTFRIGVAGKYTISNLPSNISHMISYGLTDILPNGMATTSPLTSGWTIKNDGKEYLFFLRPNLAWQDGTKVKKEDIKSPIEGIEFKPADKGIAISLESAFSPLPSFLDAPIFKDEKTGLGSYKIKKAVIKQGRFSSLILVSNKTNKKFIFKFYPNEKDLITAFKLGEIDTAWEVSNIQDFSDKENISIQTESTTEKKYVAIFFNTRKEPFSSKRIRQALAYAIKKPGKKDRAISPIAPSSWAYNSQVKTYDFDPDHAKEMLEEEGWQQEENQPIQIYCLPELMEWADNAKRDWEENLGLKSEIHVSSFVPNKEEFDVFLGFGIIPPDPDQYPIWHSTQQGNLTGINSPRIDQLLEKGRKTFDLTERKKIYIDFQQTLSEESPAIFLYYPPSYTISRQ